EKQKEVAGKTFEELEEIENWELAFQHPYFKPTELTGKYLKKDGTNLVFDQTTNRPTIELQFNDEGALLFEQITERNTEKPLAIFLDGLSIVDTTDDGQITAADVYAPIVQGKISGGKAVITGNMGTQKANEIVRRLNSGALPVKIGEPISQKTVGPTLGKVSLEESLFAGILGFLAILIFLIIFYRIPGLLASFSLLIYIALMLSLVKLFGVVLTLAGIAGFILSIGMAVDANILIFSRMREEIKEGKTFKQSISEGLKRAWPSIRDGNFTTILVALVLFFLGTSFVKGFALTLMLGNIIGMFTSIFITNYFLKFFSGEKTPRPMWLWH
ncbi:protein translocase subunit SecD, partial [Patescibacteria group bacterium]|nr:protein translocase subunit SecD [Patescibacteria group bacterium]